jgi:hypothetical protein
MFLGNLTGIFCWADKAAGDFLMAYELIAIEQASEL